MAPSFSSMKKVSRIVGGTDLVVLTGDITLIPVDAMVNAANSSLLGGGGVDGAIHRAGGAEILAACRQLGGCVVGDAKATTAGNLPAQMVIHTVGPRWRGGDQGEADLLASCHRRALAVAAVAGMKSVSFPAISTGVYGYPLADAALVALGTAGGELKKRENSFSTVQFVLYSLQAWRIWARALADLTTK